MARDVSTLTIELKAEDSASGVFVKVGESTEKLETSLTRLGVTLENEVAAKIAKNNEILRAASTAFEAGRISADDFARTSEAVGKANEKLKKSLGGAQESAEKAQGSLSRFADFLKSRFVVTLGDVANAARAAFRLIEESASLAGATEALKRNLNAQGLAFDEYLAKLDEAAAGTIATGDLIKSAGQAIILGIPAEKIAGLLEIARASSVATGQDITQAFDDIVKGVARGSAAILDNLGIIVKAEEAYASYAASLGKSASDLTAVEQKQAILNEVLRVGEERVRAFGNAQSETTTQIQKGKATLKELQELLGNLLIRSLQAVSSGAIAMGLAFSVAFEGTVKLFRGITELGSLLPLVGNGFRAAADKAKELDDAIDVQQQRFAQYAIDLANAAFATDSLGEAQGRTVSQSQAMIDGLRSTEAVFTTYETAADRARKATEEGEGAYEGAAEGARNYRDTLVNELIPALERTGQKAKEVTPFIEGVFDRSGRAIQGVVGFSQGGTRAELAGGGSRLVGRVGGTFGSQQRVAGDATYIADPLSGRIERVG